MSALLPFVPTAIDLAGKLLGNKKSKEASKDAQAAGQKAIVDPAQIAQIARETAAGNLANSAALEKQYAPGQAEVRTAGLRNLLAQINGGDPYGDLALSTIAKQIDATPGNAAPSELLHAAFRKAGSDLALGGKLDTQTRNEVTGNALTTAGRVGGGRLDLGRYIVPRDLGLSSLALGQQRLGTATNLGQIQQGVNQSTVDNALRSAQLRASLAGGLQAGSNNQANRYLSMAQFGQGLQQPEGGLSPGDVASLFLNNANNSATAGINAAKLKAEEGKNTAALGSSIGGAIGSFDWSKILKKSA